ncbi:MAG TPA: NHLP-related RiPP peptide [Rhodanobacteraceae bacterium]|nr:NHLP-related RiPP peptide [Rhodanobacteraceae bacterium]
MADSKLSREHSLVLLHKLATDDGFRSRYEQKPAATLADLGVPLDTIVNLKASCLAPATLAPKDHFVQAHTELAESAVESCVGMIPPMLKLDLR